MKNTKINWWSFASAKLIIAFAVIIGFSMMGCDDGGGSGGSGGGGNGDGGGGGGQPEDTSPENMPVNDRWSKWVAEDSTATIDYSVDENGVCTITVGGTAEPHDWSYVWNIYKVNCSYAYTGTKDTSYIYKFEAWTQSGNRDILVQYYNDYDNEVYLFEQISITSEPHKTYTIYGDSLPKGNVCNVEFQCADQLGTFYIKILEITEYTIGKLTITNFSDSFSPYSWVRGKANNLRFATHIYSDENYYGLQVVGNTIILPVWVEYDDYTFIPFTGNKTIAAGDLSILNDIQDINNEWGERYDYINKVDILFTNGNATIDFGTQMELDE